MVVAAVEGRQPAGKHATYEGRVMCFFEVGDGKGTLLRFDYEHPPAPPKPNALWHLGKIAFNKTLLPHGSPGSHLGTTTGPHDRDRKGRSPIGLRPSAL